MIPHTKGCLRFFEIKGITVLVHWSWFLVAAFELYSRADTYPSLIWNLAEYLTLFAIVLLHEFGHALACRQVGGVADRIVLWPLGGVAYVNPPRRPGAVLWSIAAGPLVNVALVPLTLAPILLVIWEILPPFPEPVMHFCISVAVINAILLAFNLLPVYPLDGGQILHALLWFIFGYARSLMVCGVIGVIGALALAILSFIYLESWWGIILAAFVGYRALVGIMFAYQLVHNQEAIELVDRAIKVIGEGDHDAAIDHCNRALELLPQDGPFTAGAYAVRGMAWAARSEHDHAIDDYTVAIRLQPKTAAYRLNRGASHSQLGHYDRAVEDYLATLSLDGTIWAASNNLAWIQATCPDPAY